MANWIDCSRVHPKRTIGSQYLVGNTGEQKRYSGPRSLERIVKTFQEKIAKQKQTSGGLHGSRHWQAKQS